MWTFSFTIEPGRKITYPSEKYTLLCYLYGLSFQKQDVSLPSGEDAVIHHSLMSNLNRLINIHLFTSFLA